MGGSLASRPNVISEPLIACEMLSPKALEMLSPMAPVEQHLRLIHTHAHTPTGTKNIKNNHRNLVGEKLKGESCLSSRSLGLAGKVLCCDLVVT